MAKTIHDSYEILLTSAQFQYNFKVKVNISKQCKILVS